MQKSKNCYLSIKRTFADAKELEAQINKTIADFNKLVKSRGLDIQFTPIPKDGLIFIQPVAQIIIK